MKCPRSFGSMCLLTFWAQQTHKRRRRAHTHKAHTARKERKEPGRFGDVHRPCLMAPHPATKVKPNSKRIWTPNHSTGGIRARRFPFAPSISAPYTPPSQLPAPRKTLTELNEKSIVELQSKMAIWEEEADRLEFGPPNAPLPTLEEQLAQLLCKDNLISECCSC